MDAVEDRLFIAADPECVYRLVSDITRMGEWSPENTGGHWADGAGGPGVGKTFRGSNRRGWRRWTTTCTVTKAEPGREFAFNVDYLGFPASEWSYVFEPAEGGCTVTERWRSRRLPGTGRVGDMALGIRDRAEHNLAGIRTTLAALKSAAEAPG